MLLRCFSFYFGASLSSGGGRIGTSILSRMVGVGDFDNGDIALLLGGLTDINPPLYECQRERSDFRSVSLRFAD